MHVLPHAPARDNSLDSRMKGGLFWGPAASRWSDYDANIHTAPNLMRCWAVSFLLTFVAQATFSAHTWQTRSSGLQALMTPHLGVGLTSVLPWAGMAHVTVSCWPAQPHTRGRPGALGQVCSGKGSIPGLSTAHSSQETTLPPETPSAVGTGIGRG